MKKFVLAIAILTLGSSVVLAHPHRGHRSGKQAMRRAFAQLDLTEGQKNSIRAIRERDADKFRSLHTELRQKGRVYRQLRAANDPQAENVRAEIKQLREAARIRRETLRSEIRGLLNPAQRQKLDAMKQRRENRRNR